MKEIIEKVMPENIDLIEEFIRLAEERKCWIFLSDALRKRLENTYKYRNYIIGHGALFYRVDPSKIELYVDYNYTVWHRVAMFGVKDVRIASDPEVIYFLS